MITCRVPTLFHLVWSGAPPTATAAGFSSSGSIAGLRDFDDFYTLFSDWTPYGNTAVFNITVTAYACCHCDLAGSPETTTLLEPPCSLTPPRFMATKAYFTFEEPEYILTMVEAKHTEALEKLAVQLGNISAPDFTSTFQNVFQMIYHLVRLDLGVIVDNQIYNSPQMFNLSIMPVNIPAYFGSSSANKSRAATSNPTLMAQWRQRVAFYQTSDRVPVMDYLRPVPRLKPLGSAITSVFVSTFAMLSALWTIFSLGAGVLARRTAPQSERSSSTHDDLGGRICGESAEFAINHLCVHSRLRDSGWDTGTSSSFDFHKEAIAPWQIPLEYVQDDIREMRRTMDSMRRLLENQGLAVDLDDSRLDLELKSSSPFSRSLQADGPAANSNSKDDILSHHRTSASSDWA
ncbi:hypothetical protein B0H14DRAFT_2635393 [Mycena olivaceomarginata]|nr:hypothetical protein B0H14DRAFT_2635393 [Mycena olivaceomarginata]